MDQAVSFDLTPLAPFDANNYSPLKGGFALQAKAYDRAVALANGKFVKLTTLPGDDHIAGSGDMLRCDLTLDVKTSMGFKGAKVRYGNRMMFVDPFQPTTWQPYIFFDFHNDGAGPAANFHINVTLGEKMPGLLRIQGFGGDPDKPIEYGTVIGEIEKYRWYNFDHHIHWTDEKDGFVESFLDEIQILEYHGPTLFLGQGTYLKLANYRLPPRAAFPEIDGVAGPSSIIHALPTIDPLF